MNSNKVRFLVATCAVLNFCTSLALAQQEAKESHSLVGGIAEPLGAEYESPKKLNADVTRITAYRPAVGFGVGVATMEVNGHYHTSLQLGSFTQICLKPTKSVTLGSRLVETGVPVKSEVDVKTDVLLKQGQEQYVRLSDQGNGRASIEVVNSETAASELKATRKQAHAVSRVAESVPCDTIVNEPQQSASTAVQAPKKVESITLASDALFGFGKSDAQAIPASGRASLDRLIERLLKQYGTFENTQVQVIGYADPLGNPSSNRRLSEERAQAIKGYMVEGGIASTKISSEGRGATDLIVTKCASTPTPTPASIECNKPNRRVVVTVSVTEPR